MVKQIRRFVTLVIVSLLVVSCKHVGYIRTHSYDTIRTENVKIDSIFVGENVKERIYIKNDTVFLEFVKVVYKDRYKYVYDTAFVHKVDTIQIPIPIEHKSTLWEQIKGNVSELINITTLITFVCFILWFISLLRRKK